jgi:hypothetical protein
LDYPEDFEVFKRVIEGLSQNNSIFDLEAIINYLKLYPEIIKINQFLDEQYWQRTRDKAKLQYLNLNGILSNI